MITRRAFLIALAAGAAGCSLRRSETPASPKSSTIIDPRTAAAAPRLTTQEMLFTDVSSAAGLIWQFNSGGNTGRLVIDQVGGGVAFFDYNNDGLLDIFAVQGGPLPGATGADLDYQRRNVLYRNNGDGTFTDVTSGSGLDAYTGYGMGVSVADFDNDGWPDLYVTAYGGSHLFRNNRNGTFTDVTAHAGLADIRPQDGTGDLPWPTSSAWADYDNDGLLDLFVCHYYLWSMDLGTSMPCDSETHEHRVNCDPASYKTSHSRLFHNNGDGTFTDVSKHAGLEAVFGKALGAAWVDYDDDGWMDLFITNDGVPNNLLHNNRDGTFTDVGVTAGVADNERGTASAGMGIAVGDYDNDGKEDLFVVNFARQVKSVYHNLGNGVFENVSYQAGMSAINVDYLGFAVECFDYDLDGYKDLIYGNGHIRQIAASEGTSSYEQSQQLLHNQRDGTFKEDLHALGDLTTPLATRGLAIGDFDNDGDIDVLMVSQTGPLKLFRNDGGNKNNWITFTLEGVHCNRDAIGAKITIHSASGIQVQGVRGGSSYCSHSDRRVTFGLASLTAVDRVEIRWPGGKMQTLGALSAGKFYRIRQGDESATIIDNRQHSV